MRRTGNEMINPASNTAAAHFWTSLKQLSSIVKVSVNENFSALLDFRFLGFLAWVGPKFYFGRKRKSESAF